MNTLEPNLVEMVRFEPTHPKERFYRPPQLSYFAASPQFLVRVENFEISTLWLKARYSASELHPHITICFADALFAMLMRVSLELPQLCT